MLLYKTMILSNLNLSMPYKTGFNKTDRDSRNHIPRKLDQTLPIPRQSHILSMVLKDEERVKVYKHSKT